MTRITSDDYGAKRAESRSTSACVSRRELLILGGSAVAVVAMIGDQSTQAQVVGSRYPERFIAKLKDVIADKPIEFAYPSKDITNVLVKLGVVAGGGIGAGKDIVAFNNVCTHMGGPVGAESYKAQHKVLGPCPLHLTTFDLTRHGMVVSGHATAALPQVMLEVRGDDIIAVGMMGLVYGYSANPRA